MHHQHKCSKTPTKELVAFVEVCRVAGNSMVHEGILVEWLAAGHALQQDDFAVSLLHLDMLQCQTGTPDCVLATSTKLLDGLPGFCRQLPASITGNARKGCG